jgi:hypothetical protein
MVSVVVTGHTMRIPVFLRLSLAGIIVDALGMA